MSIMVTRQAATWGMLCHLSALLGLALPPFGNLLGPLVVWLLKRNQYRFVDSQGKESLNFQISMTIYGFVAAILILVLIGWVLLGLLAIANIILVIMAAVRASNGKGFRYPLTIRFIK